jgi:predicted O-methyltransferase YrrM
MNRRHPRWLLALLALLLVLQDAWLGWELLRPPSDDEILAMIEGFRGPGYANVPAVDGKFLHDMIVEKGYRRALEVGTSSGYSGAWIGMALRRTKGRLVTLEIDEDRAELARRNFRAAGLDGIIEVITGDARQTLPTLSGPFDFVFIDAEKTQYVDYLKAVLPKVSKGGAIVAHNVTSHSQDLQEFLKILQTDQALETSFNYDSPAGLSISLKKR